MEDHEIKKAVEAIMSLRPQPKTTWEGMGQRIINKRRYDDWLHAREMAEINAGESMTNSIDFFAVRSKKEASPHSSGLIFRPPSKTDNSERE
ncbi:hypothetical protein J7I01_004633 [Vibrio parahaemolyticus]|nr:hypothetical protein [Vibrio parahaemolyticus]